MQLERFAFESRMEDPRSPVDLSLLYTAITEREYQENGRLPGICYSGNWSGIRESNPRLDLGKVAYYHYTNPAWKVFYSMRGRTATRVARRRRFG